jgi:hypothetical protein
MFHYHPFYHRSPSSDDMDDDDVDTDEDDDLQNRRDAIEDIKYKAEGCASKVMELIDAKDYEYGLNFFNLFLLYSFSF